MPLIVAEFLVMAGAFTVIFAILICMIRSDPYNYDSYVRRKNRRIQRENRNHRNMKLKKLNKK